MRQRGLRRRLKRAADVAAASGLLVATAPLMATIAAAIRVRHGGPVVFRQKRVGRGEQVFVLYKFRTLTEARDAEGQLLPDEARLTRLGAMLRRASLDELPQLVNVLKGEMSLVGPRPQLVRYVPRYNDTHRRRHEVLPGITGWAQVKGRNALDWNTRLDLDVWYVDHWSLGLDTRILLLTVGAVLRPREVSAPGHATMPEFEGS